MAENWVKIYSTTNSYTAEILKQGLVEANIPAVTINKQVSAYQIGEINVMVNAIDFDRAIEYLVANEIV